MDCRKQASLFVLGVWPELQIFKFSFISVLNTNYQIYCGFGLPLRIDCVMWKSVSWYVLLQLLCSYGHFYLLSHFHQLSFSPTCEPFSTGMLRQTSEHWCCWRCRGKHLNAWKSTSSFNVKVVYSDKLGYAFIIDFFCHNICITLWSKILTFHCLIVLISYQSKEFFAYWVGGKRQVGFSLL